MNDLSVTSRLTVDNSASSLAHLVQSIARLCDASAQAAELLLPMPSLLQTAQALMRAGLQGVMGDHNPDTLFINGRTTQGSLLSSVSLTQAMIQSLAGGPDDFDSGLFEVYTRHDTVDERYLAKHPTVQGLNALFAYAREHLITLYLHQLDEFWSQEVGDFFKTGQVVTRQKAWATLQGVAFGKEVQIAFLEEILDEQDNARLDKMLTLPIEEGAYCVSLSATDQPTALLHTALAIAQQVQSPEALAAQRIEGPVFLLTMVHGIEKFSSLSALNNRLRERWANPLERGYLMEDLLLEQAGQLSAIQEIEVRYSPCRDYWVRVLAKASRAKQVEDYRYLLDTARQRNNASSLLAAVARSQALTYLDDGRRESVHSHMRKAQVLSTPHWLKYASEQDLASYEIFNNEYLRRAAATSHLLAGLESAEQYAISKVEDYIRQHLGYHVDIKNIVVTWDDKWSSPLGELTATYRKTLLECVLEGLPLTEDESTGQVVLPPQSQHPDFTFEFVTKLVADLDVRYQYSRAQEQRYLQPATQQALLHQRDSALALSALGAQMQGHLFCNGDSDRAAELIASVRADQTKQGSVYKMGALEVGCTGNQLRDVIVFSEETDGDTFYVLYAPGAPGRRDMFVFDSWRKLYHEVAGWSATASGRDYLIAQSYAAFREVTAVFMHDVSQKPTHWKDIDVRLMPMASSSFQANVLALINMRLSYDAAELPVMITGDKGQATYSHRRSLASLDACIDFLNRRYAQSMELMSYRSFARLSGEIYLSLSFQNRGIDQTLNPDTVYFDLHSKSRRLLPDFGPYTDLISLTQLLMDDFSYKLDDNAPLYSSINQDLSALSMEIIREVLDAPLGEKYVGILKKEYKDKSHPSYIQRKALFAQRNYFAMYRDILITYLNNEFDQSEYQAMLQLLSTVYPGSPEQARPASGSAGKGSINQFYLNGCLIEGLLVFKCVKSSGADFYRFYTPNAPDGIRFRSQEEFVSSLASLEMGAYCYNRVSYKNQRLIGTFFETLVRSPQLALKSMTLDADERVHDLQYLHSALIDRMIRDVDEQTLSHAEHFAESLYTLVKWTGTILLLPFPPAAFAWGLFHTSVELFRGYQAYIDGDHATAMEYYAWGVFGLVCGASAARDIAKSTPALAETTLRWALKNHVPLLANE